MGLEQRADQRQVVRVADDDGMRVSDRDRPGPRGRRCARASYTSTSPSSCSTRPPARIRARTRRGPTRTATASAPLLLGQPDGCDPRPVAGHLRDRAVRDSRSRSPPPRRRLRPPRGCRRPRPTSAPDALRIETRSPGSACSASRYSLPAARQRENLIGHLLRGTVCPHGNEARNAAHPLPLVRRQTARPGGQLPLGVGRPEARRPRAGRGSWRRSPRPAARSARCTSSPTPDCEHRARALPDAADRARRPARRDRRRASDDASRPSQSRSPRSECPDSASSSARTTRRRSFGWTAAAASGIAPGEERMGAPGPRAS